MESKISNSEAQAEVGKLRSTFNRKVLKQRIALTTEAFMPRAVPAFYTLMASGAFTFMGGWQHIPEQYRPLLFIPMALAAVAPIPFMGGSKTKNTNPFNISRKDAIAELDTNSGDKRYPAMTIDSSTPAGSTDTHRANLAAHQNQVLREKLDILKVRKPTLDISKYTKIAGLALATAFGASVFAAGDEIGDRWRAAFDYTAPEPVVSAPRLWAAITPPKGITQVPTLYLADQIDPDATHKIHPQSTLEILSYDREANITVDGQALEVDKTLIGPTGQKTYTFKPLVLGEGICSEGCTIKVEHGQTWTFDMNTDNAPTVTINSVETSGAEDKKGILELRCRAVDDYGIKEGELVIEPTETGEGAEPPPQALFPQIKMQPGQFCP